jgi:predicted amidohydrolase
MRSSGIGSMSDWSEPQTRSAGLLSTQSLHAFNIAGMMRFKLAMIQMRVEPGRKDANLRRAADLLAQASGQEAQVALLPEAMPLGWTHPSAQTEADEVPGGESCRVLADAARRHRLYVCAGVVERDGPGVYNSAVLFNPAGQLLLHHRKINELDLAHECYAPGDRLGVTRTPWGTFGLMICADAFARGQVISRVLALMGADVVLSPCAWAVPADYDQQRAPYGQLWLDHYGPVAREFQLWIAGVSNVGPIPLGPWAGRKCIGCSLLVAPDGHPVLRGPYGEASETVLYHEVAVVPRPRPWFEPGR